MSRLAYFPIELTEEEIKSINRYINAWHTRINTVCNLTPDVQQKMKEKGIFVLLSAKASYKKDGLSDEEITQRLKSDFQQSLNDFVNVYTAMLKLNYRTPTDSLFRGTSTDLVKTQNSFISTSSSRSMAKTFKTYQEGGALIEYRLADNIPVIDIDDLAEQYPTIELNREEYEILISPFVKTAEIRDCGKQNYKGDIYNEYYITLERQELKELSQDEIEALRERIEQDFASFLSDMDDSIEYLDQCNFYTEKKIFLQKHYGEPGVLEAWKDADQASTASLSKYSSASSKVEAFNNIVVEFIQGLCRQKEIEIQKEREELEKKAYADFMAREIAQIHDNYHSTITEFEKISQGIRKMSQKTSDISSLEHDSSSKLGLRFDNSENIEMQNTYNEIQAQISRVLDALNKGNAFEDKDMEDKNYTPPPLSSYIEAARTISKLSSELNDYQEQYQSDSENRVKQQLYRNVFDDLKAARIGYYSAQIKGIQSATPGLFDGINGKNALRAEQIRALELKIDSERRKLPKEGPNYSVKDILGDIYYTFRIELNQPIPSNIQATLDKINSVYRTKIQMPDGHTELMPFPEEKLLYAKYQEHNQSGELSMIPQLGPVSGFFATRRAAKELQAKNNQFENYLATMPIPNTSSFSFTAHPDSFSNSLANLKRIATQLQSLPSYSRTFDERSNSKPQKASQPQRPKASGTTNQNTADLSEFL